MTDFKIHMHNSKFISDSSSIEGENVNDVMHGAIRGAMSVCAEEIEAGEISAAVQIDIKDLEERLVRSAVISVCVAPLST